MSEKRLMMTEEEVRKRTKELLQIPPEDLITSYMFQEQEIERLNNIIKEVREWILFQQEHSMEPYIATDMLDDILEILDKGE